MKTKIVATIPVSSSFSVLNRTKKAGMDIGRINTSKGRIGVQKHSRNYLWRLLSIRFENITHSYTISIKISVGNLDFFAFSKKTNAFFQQALSKGSIRRCLCLNGTGGQNENGIRNPYGEKG